MIFSTHAQQYLSCYGWSPERCHTVIAELKIGSCFRIFDTAFILEYLQGIVLRPRIQISMDF